MTNVITRLGARKLKGALQAQTKMQTMRKVGMAWELES